MKIDTIR